MRLFVLGYAANLKIIWTKNLDGTEMTNLSSYDSSTVKYDGKPFEQIKS